MCIAARATPTGRAADQVGLLAPNRFFPISEERLSSARWCDPAFRNSLTCLTRAYQGSVTFRLDPQWARGGHEIVRPPATRRPGSRANTRRRWRMREEAARCCATAAHRADVTALSARLLRSAVSRLIVLGTASFGVAFASLARSASFARGFAQGLLFWGNAPKGFESAAYSKVPHF